MLTSAILLTPNVYVCKEYETDPDASRLGCQLVLSEDLIGMKIQLPGKTVNYMDHIPFDL